MITRMRYTKQSRVQRAFRPSLGEVLRESIVEQRSLAVPVFNPIGSWLVAVGDRLANVLATDPVAAQAALSATAVFTDPSGLQNVYGFSASVSNILDTVSGPDGGASIGLDVTHSAHSTADLSYNPLTTDPGGQWSGLATTAFLVNSADGSSTASWNVTDSGGATSGQLTAYFTIQYTGPVQATNQLMFWGNMSMYLITNQISVYLNATPPGGTYVPDLQIWDNTTPGGPTLVLEDSSVGGGQNSPAFTHSYTAHQTTALPFTETIAYASFFDAVTTNMGTDSGSYNADQLFKWSFHLTNS